MIFVLIIYRCPGCLPKSTSVTLSQAFCISYNGYNKWAQTQQLQQDRFFIIVLEIKGQISLRRHRAAVRCWWGRVPSGDSKSESVSLSFQLVEAAHILWLVALSPSSKPAASIPAFSTPLCLCTFFLYCIRTFVITLDHKIIQKNLLITPFLI